MAGGLVGKAARSLFKRANRFSALYADGADINGFCGAVYQHFLFLEIGLEDPFRSLVGMAVGIAGNGLFAANIAFISHDVIITNLRPPRNPESGRARPGSAQGFPLPAGGAFRAQSGHSVCAAETLAWCFMYASTLAL